MLTVQLTGWKGECQLCTSLKCTHSFTYKKATMITYIMHHAKSHYFHAQICWVKSLPRQVKKGGGCFYILTRERCAAPILLTDWENAEVPSCLSREGKGSDTGVWLRHPSVFLGGRESLQPLHATQSTYMKTLQSARRGPAGPRQCLFWDLWS
jgi:hypothetical protein